MQMLNSTEAACYPLIGRFVAQGKTLSWFKPEAGNWDDAAALSLLPLAQRDGEENGQNFKTHGLR